MLLLHTDSLGKYGLHRVFSLAKKAGYDGIELGVNAKNLDTQNPEYLKNLAEEAEIKIIVVETPEMLTEKKMEVSYKVAKAVGATTIVVQPPNYFDYHTTKWLKANAPKLRSHDGLKVLLKNMPDERTFGVFPKYAMTNTTDLREFKQMALDLSNLVTRSIPALEYYEQMHDFVFHVHLSNYRGNKDHALPMDGKLPLESFLKKMKKRDYAGHFSVKVRPEELHAGAKDSEILEQLKKIKEFVEEYFS
jgi:sugar phosphate isomerase/epimerase